MFDRSEPMKSPYTNTTHVFSPDGSSYLQFIIGLSIFDPSLALSLRINEEWVTGSFGHNQAILNR